MSKPVRYALAGGTFTLAYSLLFLLRPDAVDAYVEEDGVVETIGAAALLACSVAFTLTLIRGRRRGILRYVKQGALLLLAVAFLFGAGEEISWGQRIFGFDTPSGLEAVNAQDELNIHNLDTLNGWLNADRMFQAFWVSFGVLLPIAAAGSTRTRDILEPLLPILAVGVAAALIGNQVLAELSSLVEQSDSVAYDGVVTFDQARFEVTEMLVALIFAFGAVNLLGREPVIGSEVRSEPAAASANSKELPS